MKMYFDEIFIPHGQQAVAFKVPGEMVVHRVLIQVFALDQELCVIPKFRHTAALLFYFFAFCPPALFSYSSFTAARPSKTS